MTTSVTVNTCSWPVRVSIFPVVDGQPAPDGEWTKVAEVEPESTRTFYVHSGADLLVQELPLPADSPTVA